MSETKNDEPMLEGQNGTRPAMRVLVVEDNLDAAESMRLLLALRGHDVAVAHDSERAMTMLRSHAPALVLMDLNLADTDGFTLVGRMIAERAQSRPRFVSISGLSDPEDEARAIAAGFEIHLVKPVDPGRLFDLCDRVSKDCAQRDDPASS